MNYTELEAKTCKQWQGQGNARKPRQLFLIVTLVLVGKKLTRPTEQTNKATN